MDKGLYIDTSSAKEAMHQLEIITNNLANVNTPGFRADLESVKQVPVHLKGIQSRIYSTHDKSYSDFTYGATVDTGRDLDAAISGEGFFAIQNKNGQEGYTRAGNFIIQDGFIKTAEGERVMGTNGPINVGPAQRINFGNDGTVMALLPGNSTYVTIGRLKLTNPPLNELTKGADGLFYLAGTNSAPLNDKVQLTPRALEGSNVNTVEALTTLIDLSRNFEMHTNVMKAMQDAATKANQILQAAK